MMEISAYKPYVAVDLIDVIEDAWVDKREWLRANFGHDFGPTCKSRWLIEEYVNNHALGEGGKIYKEMAEALYTSERILARRPVAGAVQSLNILREYFHLVVLSGRRERKRTDTEKWLSINGLGWLVGPNLCLLDFVPEREAGRQPIRKLEWCVDNKAIALVENQAIRLCPVTDDEYLVTRILLAQEMEEAGKGQGILMADTWDKVTKILVRIVTKSSAESPVNTGTPQSAVRLFQRNG